MPTIEFNKYDFFELIDQEMDEEEMEEKLTEIGVELEYVKDDRVAVETTSDRIDLLSVEGIARNMRSYYGDERGLKKYALKDEGFRLVDEGVKARPEIVAAVVKGVNLNTAAFKSLIQLQEKLHGTFGRHREKVSIGVHDMDGIMFPLRYLGADPEDTSFIPLGKEGEMTLEEILEKHDKGKEYGHIVSESDRWPLILDSEDNVLSFPPVINGVLTEVSEDTENVFIDVTGTSREEISYALNVLVTALAERGGDIHEVEIERVDGAKEKYPDLSPKEFELDMDYIRSTVGIDMEEEDLKEYLEKMGHGTTKEEGKITALIPPYRSEMLHQIDVVEDVAMGYGYSNITPEIPNISTIGEEDDLEEFNHLARELMVGFGYQEIMNPTLRNHEILLDRMKREDEENLIEIKDPVSEKYTSGRDSLLPQLLETLSLNTHNSYPQRIFESADTIIRDEDSPYKAVTRKKISAVTADIESDMSNIVSEVKGLLRALGVELEVREAERPFMIEGRSGELVTDDGEVLGYVGEIHPEVLENFDIEVPVAGFELDLTRLNFLS